MVKLIKSWEELKATPGVKVSGGDLYAPRGCFTKAMREFCETVVELAENKKQNSYAYVLTKPKSDLPWYFDDWMLREPKEDNFTKLYLRLK